MRARLRANWDEARSSYWFVPAVMVLFALALSFATIAIDQQVQYEWVRQVGFLWSGGAEGARGLLSAVASSVITVAGVVFSITLTALSLASQQFGPRLLRNFMRDTGNQVVLGTFVATFIYSIMVLRTIRSGDAEFVPYVSVTVALFMTLASVAVLIYFFHHASLLIQAPVVIAGVAGELRAAFERLLPDEAHPEATRPLARTQREQVNRDPQAISQSICAERSGYIQAVDDEALLACATANDTALLIAQAPGDFIIPGQPLVKVMGGQPLPEATTAEIRDAFTIGIQRTEAQDVRFAIDQLVEVAVRSLSPGINDPFTAIACIDWLASELAVAAARPFPAPWRADEAGRLRIVVERPVAFATLVEAAFAPIRQYAGSSVAVRIRLVEALAAIGERATGPEDRHALLRQAAMIHRGSEELVPEASDRQDIARRYEWVAQRLQGE